MRYLNSVLEAVGNIPLVRLQKIVGPDDATLLVKPEFLNPGGSIKDRMAMYILDKAEREGRLKPGGIIVENTSGNTGAGVALWAATRGYRCVFTMPDKMSKEKIDTLKGFGAEVVVTPTNVPAEHPSSYYETAKRIARETPNSFYLNQYHNPDNIEAHYKLTGPEIFEQSQGKIDYFVAGLGTGGTMSGAGKFLKEKIPGIKNVGVDPIGSIYHDYFKTGKMTTPHVYKVEGIGEDMLCKAMDFSVLDEVRQVDDRQSFLMARRLAREEGLFAGGSSGAAVHVAAQVAREAGKGKIVVAILPDHGNRYISKFYSDEWMRDNGFLDGRGLGLVRDLVASLRQEVITARADETCAAVVARMKQFGISQMPVVNARGEAQGMIHEYDLLQFLLEGKHRADEKIEVQVAPLQGVVMMDTPLSRLKDIFAQDNVAVVKDGEKVVAVITKIDLIDFLSKPRA